MGRARFRFHGELNDFLPRRQRGAWLEYGFRDRPSIKHAIETFGVPHPEVGEPPDLSAPLGDGAEIEVRPRRYEDPPDGGWRFVLDGHLGRLAKYLRILGFDTLYEAGADDRSLADAAASGRFLLTRDRSLLMRRAVSHGLLVRHDDPRRQLEWLASRLGLWPCAEPLTRCLRCNAPLEPVAKESVWDRIPPKTRLWCSEYRTCRGCGQLYWPGSHYERMQAWIRALRGAGR
ncbi:MAG: Mut7-C ubiquitin/RNAse domain-containing protein [Bryobacteraceae bacterium]|nr:Mut7-C ubiquitin/RNAse domain-containing protein [Bryobacteraceae bacterium]MCX7602673.1 Mut7-C ubiquitin/RNAse domain-containing protein [Bryobacteraceae bacterium]